jgi:predicted metal-dependent peptidase
MSLNRYGSHFKSIFIIYDRKMSMNSLLQKEQIEELAREIMQLARDHIVVNMQFMDMALKHLPLQAVENLAGMAVNGKSLLYDPVYVLKKYKEEPNYVTRVYLHILLHCIFFHSFQYDKLQKEYWDMATDMALEHIIIDMKLPNTALRRDEELKRMLADYKRETGRLTAEKLYRNFLVNEPSVKRQEEIKTLFGRDIHEYWKSLGQEEMSISIAEWQKISERIKANLKSFSKDKTRGEALKENLTEAMREKYDYSGFLRRFMTMGEQIKVNDDEFDYIYYTYGLREYGNMPLVEPLEYADDKKIKEFVIAIDTSASCRGRTVQSFLQKTYSIMKGSENFFRKINVHIIQCDSDVQSDTKITNQEEFDRFMKNGKFVGFGSTDFRPVFTYIDELIAKREFENLKGLIYFTDGYGTYPEKIPDYDVAFVFLSDDLFAPQIPPWAIKLVLQSEDVEQE